MTETSEPRDKAQDTVAMTAATMGHDIVAAMLGELRTMPGIWSTLNAEQQQKIIERMKDKTMELVRKSISFMLTSDFAAVSAKLEFVSRKKGIHAGLTVDTNAPYRHKFSDACGQHVLVVIADPAQWLTRMDEIKARGNQLDLFDPSANYDPAVDQPGYRRDRDPLAPGASWEEMKKALGIQPDAYGRATDGTNQADAETKAADTETNGTGGESNPTATDTSGESLTPEQEHQAAVRELQARLSAIGCDVSLGALQSRTDADILAASLWLNWYESEGINVPYLERPAFLPEPPNRASN